MRRTSPGMGPPWNIGAADAQDSRFAPRCTRFSQHYSNMRALLLKDEQSNHALSAIKQEMEFQLAFIKGKANLIDHIRSEEPTDPSRAGCKSRFLRSLPGVGGPRS